MIKIYPPAPKVLICALSLYASTITAQTNVFQNNGILQIKNKTVLSSYSDFYNQAQGLLINDGMVYYFGDFMNDGDFTYTKSLATGEVQFGSSKKQNTMITGAKTVELNHVTFNCTPAFIYDLKTHLDIWGATDFKEGVIVVDDEVNTQTNQPMGLISFMPKSSHKNSSSTSFIDGMVEKIGADPFVFPVGNKKHYRPAKISAPKNNKEVVTCNYVFSDPVFFETHQTHAPEIKEINTQEYWKIETIQKNKTSFVLTLSWDEETISPHLLQNPEQNLHIVRWNPTTNQWEDLGGIVDVENKTITTPATLSNFGYFTLATMQVDNSTADEIVIYNYVNATGGDKNDYFIIENINNYPENSVIVYNRWGGKVYETKNYNSKGNVFRGYQQGGGKLPSGTYYYLITYKKQTNNTTNTVKKTGYLHLDAK